MDMRQILEKCWSFGLTNHTKRVLRSQTASGSNSWTSAKLMAVLVVFWLSGSVLSCEGYAEAASNIIVVTTNSDTSTSGDGSCSLREAINNSNSPGIDTTSGDCTIGTGTDIVHFISTFDFNGNPVALKSALPAIANNLTVDGATQGATIGADGWTTLNAPIVKVNSGATGYFANLAIVESNGTASIPIYNDGGMVTISNVSSTTASVYNGGTMTITNSFVGIGSLGTLTVTNSYVLGLGNGGTATVTNTTFTGISNEGTLTVRNSTSYAGTAIINNSGSATFSNSIFGVGGYNFDEHPECIGNPIINGGYNISIDGSCGFGTSTGASGQTIGDNVDPRMDLYVEGNGGPTGTIALQTGSPAIAAVPGARCPATDQRGKPRPAPGQTACDIGAFELQPPARITVNTVSDTSTSGDGFCSLREAITNANSAGTDTTGGDCAVGTGEDLIVFSLSGQITLSSALPRIEHSLMIDGTAQTIAIDGANLYRIFWNDLSLSLTNLTLSHGSATDGYGGAAILNFDHRMLTVANCTFLSNRETDGIGGGAIRNLGVLTVTNSTFVDNSVPDLTGGAAIANGGFVRIVNSTFSGNTATGFGPYEGTLSNNEVAGWIGQPFAITNSILANNVGANCGTDTTYFGDHNISDDANCSFGASTGANGQPLGDNIDPQLDPNGLQNNGGPAETIALQLTSPAIGAVPAGSTNCPGTDQRGDQRPAPGHPACDAGAYEDQAQYTQAGSNVTVSPNSTTNLTFSSISSAGLTTSTTNPMGPTQPTGFYFGNPATFVDISTTAAFSGNITVCNSYDPTQYTDPAHLSLLHFQNGAWVDVTTSNDMVHHIVCGQVTSLSPFTVAQKAACDTTYSGTVKGNLTVASGSTCIIGGTITAKVTQTGGRLLVSGASIGGNLQILGGDFSVGSGTTIGGNLQVSNLSASKLQYQICSTKVNGNLQLQSNAAVIAVGGANCAGATVGGNIQVQNNTATMSISNSTAQRNILVMNNSGMTSVTGDSASGNIEVQNNADITQVMSNSAAGHLDCTGNNASMIGGPNSANQLQGQCF
jgi:CSLREA domain-containing protein